MSIVIRFTNGGETSAQERRDITSAYVRWDNSTRGDSNDEEMDASRDLIEQVMKFGGIEVDEDDDRECENCGDHVGYLSSRDRCDGCEGQNHWPTTQPPDQTGGE